jgi:hypothetical protein
MPLQALVCRCLKYSYIRTGFLVSYWFGDFSTQNLLVLSSCFTTWLNLRMTGSS